MCKAPYTGNTKLKEVRLVFRKLEQRRQKFNALREGMGEGALVKGGRDYFQLEHQKQKHPGRAGCGPRL